VINVEGEVVPCVFANPLLPSHYIFKDQSLPLKVMSFGNIRNENLTLIWNKNEYAGFRALFDPETTRKSGQIRSEMPQCCKRCYKRLEESVCSHQALSEAAPVSDMVRALC
jgi:MoaA/NifB/PqqE/SkfB family radical SAM enzyme